jgi:hypothetical protein
MIRWFLDIARRKYGNGSRGVCTVRVVALSLIAGALLAVAAVPADAGHRGNAAASSRAAPATSA